MAESSPPVLELVDIHRGYKSGSQRVEVLEGAALAIGEGEMIALVAPSGAGKSTLLHVAGLLETPDAGDVLVDGEPSSQMSDANRTRRRRGEIGFVYQFHHLLPELTALENIMMPQLLRGLSKAESHERAAQLMAYLKIDHRQKHRPSELSGGEQQRVAIARAVANAPRMLLADEPTGNLDPSTSSHVFGAIETLVTDTGLAALIATHNHDLAARTHRRITIRDRKVIDFDT